MKLGDLREIILPQAANFVAILEKFNFSSFNFVVFSQRSAVVRENQIPLFGSKLEMSTPAGTHHL